MDPFLPQHLVHGAADSSGALHHEACLPCLLQADVPQQYCLRQPSGSNGGLIMLSNHLAFSHFFVFVVFVVFFFHHLGRDLNFDGNRHFRQQRELFLNVNFTVCAPHSVSVSPVEDQ